MAKISEIEPERVAVLQQDSFKPWRVRQARTMNQSLFFVLTPTVTNESASVVLRHRKSSRCESMCSCVGRQNSEQASSCHSSKAGSPLHRIGSKAAARGSSFTIRAVGPFDALQKRGAQPLAKRHGACISGMAILWASIRRGGPPASTPL